MENWNCTHAHKRSLSKHIVSSEVLKWCEIILGEKIKNDFSEYNITARNEDSRAGVVAASSEKMEASGAISFQVVISNSLVDHIRLYASDLWPENITNAVFPTAIIRHSLFDQSSISSK